MDQTIKLHTANGNIPLTEEQKLQIIEDASKAYEKYLDALRIDWRNDPNSDNTPTRVAKAFVNDLAAGCYNDPPKVTAFPSDGTDAMEYQRGIHVKYY